MIEPKDLLVYARNLHTATAKEVQLRSAISRAYYAAFHYCDRSAQKFCDELSATSPELSKGVGTQEKVYIRMERYCREPKVKEDVRTMAQVAKNLRNLRTDADYKLHKTVGGKEATRGLSYASQVERLFNEIITPSRP